MKTTGEPMARITGEPMVPPWAPSFAALSILAEVEPPAGRSPAPTPRRGAPTTHRMSEGIG